MGLLSSLDWFFSSNVLKSLLISMLPLAGGVLTLFVPRFFDYEPGSQQYEASKYAATGGIIFGLSWLLVDALWTHVKVLYQCMTRDSMRERLIQTGPATNLA